MTRVLVTGANGFVGKALCSRLLESRYTPRAGLRSCGSWPELQTAVPGLSEFAVLGELGGGLSLISRDFDAALENVAVLIHLSARVHRMHDTAVDPWQEYKRINVDGTEALARAAARQGVRRMVFVSTSKVSVESTSGKPFREGDTPSLQDAYAFSKWAAEGVLRSVASSTGLEVAIVRPPLVYGPGVHANFLRLIRLVKSGIPLPLPDTGNRRSLIGVANLADFLVRCASHRGAANATLLVSDGEDVSTRELIVRLARALGRSARFLPVPECAVRLAARLIGKQDSVDRLFGSLVIDSMPARQRLEWRPPVSLDAGLADTARWFLESSRQLVHPKAVQCS